MFFWDTEIWMYPALLVLHPELTKSMMEYHVFKRLDAARAEMHSPTDLKSAMYPWESAKVEQKKRLYGH